MSCAPTKSYSEGSCFSIDDLRAIAKGYNEYAEAGKVSGKPIPETLNKRDLVIALTDRLSNVCSDQMCWLRQAFAKKYLSKDVGKLTFRPKGPQGQFTWLNTTNINDIMEQYQMKYPDFKFLGAVPMDFDELPTLGIKDLDFDKLRKDGINRIGLVFNLDEHYKPGSHWVGMFADMAKGQIYYFDSYGKRPEKRVRALVSRIAKHVAGPTVDTESSYMKPDGKNSVERMVGDISYNHNRHQYKNSECGVYSISFILRLLAGETFEKINEKRITDDAVNKCRKVYFR